MDSYICATCGEKHDGFALSFAADFPDAYAELNPEEREERALCSSDQCILDDNFFAIRGLIQIPILGQAQAFEWGAWAKVEPNVFSEIDASWEEDGREFSRGPYEGRLANSLGDDLNASNLEVLIKLSPVGQRPLFTISEPHRLREQQIQGISQHEAHELSARLLEASS